MTTREEYAEAAAVFENLHTSARRVPTKEETRLAARVLRARADGAVLCEKRTDIREYDSGDGVVNSIVTYTYTPLEPQP